MAELRSSGAPAGSSSFQKPAGEKKRKGVALLDVEVDSVTVEVVAVEVVAVEVVAVEVVAVEVEVVVVVVEVGAVEVEVDVVVAVEVGAVEVEVDVVVAVEVGAVEVEVDMVVVVVGDEVVVVVSELVALEVDDVPVEVDVEDEVAVEVAALAVEVLVEEEVDVEVDSVVVVVDSPVEPVSPLDDSVTGANGAGSWCDPASLRFAAMMLRPFAQRPCPARCLRPSPLCLRRCLCLAVPHRAAGAERCACPAARDDEVAPRRRALAAGPIAALDSVATTSSRPM